MTLSDLIDDMLPKAERLREAMESKPIRIHGGTNQSPRACAKAILANLRALERMANGWDAVPSQGVTGSPPTPELATLEV